MTAMVRDVVVVAVGRTMALAMLTIRIELHGFLFLMHECGSFFSTVTVLRLAALRTSGALLLDWNLVFRNLSIVVLCLEASE